MRQKPMPISRDFLKVRTCCAALLCIVLPVSWVEARDMNPNTDWFSAARVGVFIHFLPGDAKALAQVEDFDVEALAGQIAGFVNAYALCGPGDDVEYAIRNARALVADCACRAAEEMLNQAPGAPPPE